jgi:hypothetical protein
MPKMNLTDCMTNSYSNNLGLLTMKKQSQTNPIHSVFIRVNSWLNSKQTQSKPILPAMTGKIAPLFRMPFILMGPSSNKEMIFGVLTRFGVYIFSGKTTFICCIFLIIVLQ